MILGAEEMPGLGFGHHGAAVRDAERLWFYFFGHPEGAQERRCAVYRVQLGVVDDRLITSLAKRFNA